MERRSPPRQRRARWTALLASALVAVPSVLAAPSQATSGSGTAPAARPAAANWVLAKITTPSVTDIRAEMVMTARGTGGGPLVIGAGMAVHGGPYEIRDVHVARFSGGFPTVSLSMGPARNRFRIDAVRDDGGTLDSGMRPHLEERAHTVAILFFAVNGVIAHVTWRPDMRGVSFRSSVRRGTGARALMISEPSSGVTAGAAGAGGGVASYLRRVPTGIVGAMEWQACEVCAGRWKAPDARQGMWVNLRHHAWAVCWCGAGLGLGPNHFAGPAGRWSWSWSGISAASDGVIQDGPAYLLAEPVAGAYAPVGPDWRLFAEPPPELP